MNSENSLYEKRKIYEQEARKRWNVNLLFSDLASIKRKFIRPNSQGLSDTEKEYLYYILSGLTPDNIAFLRNMKDGKAVTGAWYRDGIYKYISELTKKTIKNWRDILIHLLFTDKYYCLNADQDSYTPKSSFFIDLDSNEISEDNMKKINIFLEHILQLKKGDKQN